MTHKILVPIADGSEEIEAVSIIDVLRRAGAEVTVASVDNLIITASRGVKLLADCLIETCLTREWDLIVLPGGMPGAERLRDCRVLVELIRNQQAKRRLYAAICAAPAVVLKPHGLLPEGPAAAHPAFLHQFDMDSVDDTPVIVNGNCVTSRGPGTAIAFALKLVELLWNRAHAQAVADPMVLLHPLV